MRNRHLVRDVTRKVMQAGDGAWEVRLSLKANENNLDFPYRITTVVPYTMTN
jgi:galactose mutarotase-like enzyme